MSGLGESRHILLKAPGQQQSQEKKQIKENLRALAIAGLWNTSKEEIREDLRNLLSREPLESEVRNSFDIMISTQEGRELIKKAMKEYVIRRTTADIPAPH